MKKNPEVIHPNAAGIDIGARQFFVDAGEDDIRVFNTFTDECNALRDYLHRPPRNEGGRDTPKAIKKRLCTAV